MKKLFYIIVFLSSSFYSTAQSYRGDQEVNAGVGVIPGSWFTGAGSSSNADKNTWQFSPVYTAGYKYYLARNCALGVTVTQYSFQQDFYNSGSYYNEHHYYKAFSVNAEVKAVYVNKRRYQVYGNYGLGFISMTGKHELSPYYSDPNSRVTISAYLAPIGIKIGGMVAFYAEAGIGYKGVVNAGLLVRVAHKKQYEPNKQKQK